MASGNGDWPYLGVGEEFLPRRVLQNAADAAVRERGADAQNFDANDEIAEQRQRTKRVDGLAVGSQT